MHQESPWDLAVLNSGMLGSVIGVAGAFLISVLVMWISLRATERANRVMAFEAAMLKSAEQLAAGLVQLRYRLDPVFTDNTQHTVQLSPADVVEWSTIAGAHASALAVEGRPYEGAAKELTDEIMLFTGAVRSAAGRDGDSRLYAYGWPYESDPYYNTFLQAADKTLADWAASITSALAELRRGATPVYARPRSLELKSSPETGSKALETADAFAPDVQWFPMSHLCDDLEDARESGSLRPVREVVPF